MVDYFDGKIYLMVKFDTSKMWPPNYFLPPWQDILQSSVKIFSQFLPLVRFQNQDFLPIWTSFMINLFHFSHAACPWKPSNHLESNHFHFFPLLNHFQTFPQLSLNIPSDNFASIHLKINDQYKIRKKCSECFLATLVALHFTPVSKRVIVSN